MNEADQYQRAKSIFFEACERPADQRAAFVDAACSGDISLRDAVLRLIADDKQPASIMSDASASGALRRQIERISTEQQHRSADPPRSPARIGRYRIISRLGEGGMGVVYLAEQDQPRRQVAIKVIAPGQATRQALRRFEHEAQILGRLNHAGIAAVYEAGMHDAGEGAQPFFAMELVRGRPFQRYCEETDASVPERLRLFVSICEAVQYAHQQGVIHRDLKPANILMSEQGGEASLQEAAKQEASRQQGSHSMHGCPDASAPQPKILDFGVARLTDSDVQATTMHTAADQLIGTLAYMSPEQMSGRPEAIDTRSDVYALGVILYELLSGRLPHDVAGKSIPDMIQTISAGRPTALSSIKGTYRGDLETIVGKAMERDVSRRYPSAGELAADVQRYLRNEPIHARPPSTLYLARKFAQRNRALVGGVAAVFLALVAGIVATTWQARQAIAARDEQSELRERAQANERAASIAAARAGAIADFLRRMLASARPEFAQGEDVRIGDALDAAANELDLGALAAQPEAEAQVRLTLGETYLKIGRLAEAQRHIGRAVTSIHALHGELSAEHAAALMVAASLAFAQSDHATAIELSIRAEAALRSVHSGDHPDLAICLSNRGEYLASAGRTSETIAAKRQALDMLERLGEGETADAAVIRTRIASLEHDAHTGEPLVRHALEILQSQLGERHPRYVDGLFTLGGLLIMKGDYPQAAATLNQAIVLGEQVYGPDHPRILVMLQNLAFCWSLARNRDESATTISRIVEASRRVHGEESHRTAEALLDRADMRRQFAEYDGAADDYREALAILDSPEQEHDPRTHAARLSLALTLLHQRRDDLRSEARSLAQFVLDAADALPSDSRWMRGQAMSLLAEIALREGDLQQALGLSEQAVEALGISALVAGHRAAAANRLADIHLRLAEIEPRSDHAEHAAVWRQRAEQWGQSSRRSGG